MIRRPTYARMVHMKATITSADIKQLAGDLLEALNTKEDFLTDPEHGLGRALDRYFFLLRLKEVPDECS